MEYQLVTQKTYSAQEKKTGHEIKMNNNARKRLQIKNPQGDQH
jgi:hypothetical protein